MKIKGILFAALSVFGLSGAFAQGVGMVFQFVGVILFLAMGFTCCGSGLLSREWATRDELSRIGWQLGAPTREKPAYSAQRAITLSVFCGVSIAHRPGKM